MKKNFLLTLLLALCTSLQCWAEFNPTPGKMYALKEKTTGLYLDIQTLGIHESGHTTNSMSLNANPRLIYFEAGATAGTWRLKNGNGTYGGNFTSGRHWNTTISETPYDWSFAEETEGLTIAKSSNNYIGWDKNKTIVAGSALYNNAEGDNGAAARIYFALEDFTGVSITGAGAQGSIDIKNIGGWTTVPAGTGWTISMNVENPNGASFNQWGTSIFAIGNDDFPEKNGYKGIQFYLQSSTNGGKLNAVFDGGGHAINNVTYTGNFSATVTYNGANRLQIKTKNASDTEAINDYKVNTTLAEFSQLSYGLPTGINVKNLTLETLNNCVDYPTPATVSNGKYTFTSNKILYAGTCNKIRFTLTESAAFYNNGKNRMSFDSFELFDADGKKVELKDTYFKGNYNKSYANLLDGVNAGNNGAGCCCGAWNSADEGHDYFEITLPTSIDLGGAFSFSFVTENTTMNAKAFRIETSYQKPQDYTFDIVNAPEGVTVTYKDETLTEGAKVSMENFDASLLYATNVEGYYWSISVNETNETLTLNYYKLYTFNIVNAPSNIEVTYDGNALNNGDAIKIEEFYANNISATDVNGFIWQVDVDQANYTVTLLYKSAMQPVIDLVNRIGGAGTADNFKFVLDPTLHQTQETFVIGTEDGKILIKGTTISAITTGIGWYLNHIAKVNIAWNSLNEKTVDFGKTGAAYVENINLPRPTTTETHTSDAKYRYYLNTCTFGYSMTSWTWTRWQQEIDWMALHGINMPLQLVGMEEVWRKFLTLEDANGNRKYGYTDEAAKAFVAGPAFIAWWAMNNLEGWGGTAPGTKSGGTWEGAGGVQDDAWYVRQKNLSNSIVTRQRELGMQPVLPGWSGMVPTNFAAKSGYATRGNGGTWAGDFVRPLLLNVSNANYAEIAADYYACLKDVMGESQYYSMDPFHEGGGDGTAEDYQALYAAMEAAKPNSQWVIQQWQWSATQKLSLTNVPEGKLIVLDLFSDGSPAFDGYSGYAPQEAVFCAIPNFGGRSGLMGRLNNLTDNYFKYKAKYASIKGIGAAPEAIEQTPVTYDLIFQLPWMNGVKPNVQEWVANYAVARYGQDNEEVKAAWDLLRRGPLNYGADGIQGPVEDVWAARPNLDAKKASSWGKTLADAGGTYTPARRQMLIDAVYKLIDQEDELELADGSVYKSNYLYDLVEFGGGVMADYAYDLLLGIKAAKNASNTALYEARRDAFLQLILDMDAFRGTNLNFRLGKWTQEARDAATEVTGATTATPDWYEYNNARTILTTWSSPGTNLTDYSYRSWQGLLKDYYYKRWKYYFDNNCNGGQYEYFEWNWAHGMTHAVGQNAVSTTPLTADQEGHTSKYTREPEGNTVTEAWNLLNKYIVPITASGKSTYAYRHLENDFTSSVTVGVQTGTVDLTQFFGVNLENATLTIEGIANNVTNLKEVNISGAEGTYPATLTLGDKTTVIKFSLKIRGEIDVQKDELLALIAATEKLINQCGSISYASEEKLLQTTNPNGAFYLSTNAPEPKEGDIANLVDADMTTFFHSAWDKAVGGEHFLLVDAGDGNELQYFTFSYQANRGPFPYTIKVYGCDEKEGEYTWFATFDKDDTDNALPNAKDTRWTSSPIIANTAYRYFRFNVTDSGGDGKNATPKGEYCFVMSDFDFAKCTPEATIKPNAGIVTPQQLLDAMNETTTAKNVVANSTEIETIQEKKTELQAIYDALLQAYNSTSNPIAEAAAEAKAFLDATPASAGYPNAAEREKFLAVIEAQESVEAIEEAQADFVAATNVYMPENGKAYVIRNVHPNDATYMLTSGYEGTNPKLPTAGDNVTNANIFICRVVTGGYVFVNAEHGKYMLFHGKSGNYPLSEDGFSLTYSTDNILKINSQTGKRFGTLSIAGLRTEWQTGNKAYGTMTIKKDGSMDANGGENIPSYTDTYSSLFTFEEVAVKDYAINKPTHTPVIKEQNPLLSGIEDNQTISTFSAPYATVMPKGITAYYAQKAYNGNTLYLTAMEEGKALPAGQGVILIGSKDVNAAAIVPATEEELADIDEDNNFFKSSAAGDVTMGENDYILANGEQGIGIYKAQSKTKLKAGKAYLSFENAQQAKSFVMQFGGTPTGIENTLLGTPNAHDAIYDLSGRRVNTITKGGLYIVNGKKVFIK